MRAEVCNQRPATYFCDICLRMRTSFSTNRSSNVCSENVAFLRVCRHVGQGAGPCANRRSIQFSHLIVTDVKDKHESIPNDTGKHGINSRRGSGSCFLTFYESKGRPWASSEGSSIDLFGILGRCHLIASRIKWIRPRWVSSADKQWK